MPDAREDNGCRGGDNVKLEALTKCARVRGLAVDGAATVKSVEFHGRNAAEAIFTAAPGGLHTRIVSRDDEPSLDLVEAVRACSFDVDLFRLVSEALRTELGCHFGPHVAITSSTTEPLPNQISAVYTRCSRGSRCVYYSPTIPAPEKRS